MAPKDDSAPEIESGGSSQGRMTQGTPISGRAISVTVSLFLIIGVLASLRIPYHRSVEGTHFPKALSQAKTIYLGLKMYAGDHDGRFPDGVRDANEAYSKLLELGYLPNKDTFHVHGSAWTPERLPRNDPEKKSLKAGQNHFAYVPKLSDTANPAFPLVVDGFVERRPGVYTADRKAKGGWGGGKFAVVVRVDGSGKVERLSEYESEPGTFGVFEKVDFNSRNASRQDLFAPAPNWLAPDQRPLNPRSRD